MSISSGLASLLFPQGGKMRQVSSQGKQVPPEYMAKAIGVGEPGKSVLIQPGQRPGAETKAQRREAARRHQRVRDLGQRRPGACHQTV